VKSLVSSGASTILLTPARTAHRFFSQASPVIPRPTPLGARPGCPLLVDAADGF